MIDKNLLKLLGGNRKYLFGIVALMVLSLLANVGLTGCIVLTVKTAAQYGAADAAGASAPLPALVAPYFAAAGIFAALRFIFERIAAGLKARLGQGAKEELRRRAYEKITELGRDAASDLGMAGLVQVCLEGIEQLDLYFTSYIPQFFYCMLAPIVLFAVCLPVCWQAAAVLILLVPLIPVSIIAVSRYAKKIFAKYWGKYISMGGEFLDGVSGLEVLKVFRADGLWHKKLKESSEEFRKVTMKVLIMQLASTTIMDTVAYGGAALGIAAALTSMRFWGLSPFAALFIVLVAVEFFLPLRAFGSAFHVAMNGAGAGKKLLNLLERPAPEWGGDEVQGTSFTLELDGASFSYNSENDAVSEASMRFESGRLTGIVGTSGCGKSTVVGLLEGVLRPRAGRVLINGKEPKEISRASYYGHLAAVSNDTYLFNDTVRSNFELAKPGITEGEIYEALSKVKLDGLARGRGGVDAVITEGASNLSGGQRQRLSLAAALAADKDIYILDEATSNIDGDSETIIMDAVRALAKEKNVIVISHRLENVKDADNIYYMEAGRVAASGTHEELMRACAGYRKLYDTQKGLEFKGSEQGKRALMDAEPISRKPAVKEAGAAAALKERSEAAGTGTGKGSMEGALAKVSKERYVAADAENPSRETKRTRPWPVIAAKLLSLVGSLTGIIFLAVIGGSLGSLFALSVTLTGAAAVAKLLGAPVALSYGTLTALCIAFGLARGALRFAEQYSNHYIAFKLLAILRDKLFGALRALGPAKLSGRQKGGIIAMLTADTETLEVFYAHTISPVCIAVVNAAAVFIFTGFVSSFKIAAAALLGYAVIGVIEPVIFQKITRRSGELYRAEFASFNAYFLDSIRGIREIVQNGAGKARAEEVGRRSKALNARTRELKSRSAWAGCICTLSVSIFIILALAIGISCVAAGETGVGPMLLGVAAVFGSFGPAVSLANLPSNLAQTFASGDRVLDLMEEEPAVRDVEDGEDFEFEDLCVNGLGFSYQEAKVLEDVCFSVKRGEIVGIAGPSGCGKSTLLRLLLRFYEKDAGEIRYSGKEIDRIRTESLRSKVAMVRQDPYLFNVSIRENLLLAAPGASDEELYEACRKASVHDFIMSLPEGYDSQAGELGGRLSAGEKQRIALARAFLSGAELILLDEPTSNVDSINEGIILRAIEEMKGERSFILVSHRASAMAAADRAYSFGSASGAG